MAEGKNTLTAKVQNFKNYESKKSCTFSKKEKYSLQGEEFVTSLVRGSDPTFIVKEEQVDLPNANETYEVF